jgi:hypothetical protein
MTAFRRTTGNYSSASRRLKPCRAGPLAFPNLYLNSLTFFWLFLGSSLGRLWRPLRRRGAFFIHRFFSHIYLNAYSYFTHTLLRHLFAQFSLFLPVFSTLLNSYRIDIIIIIIDLRKLGRSWKGVIMAPRPRRGKWMQKREKEFVTFVSNSVAPVSQSVSQLAPLNKSSVAVVL